MKRTSYAYTKTVDLAYDEAVAKVTEELKKEGFGILTEIDVRETLKNKLGVEFRPYKILGACNPPYSHRALQVEEQIGLMLPCNVIVYVNDAGQTVVAAVDPVASMQAVENLALTELAEAIGEKLRAALERV